MMMLLQLIMLIMTTMTSHLSDWDKWDEEVRNRPADHGNRVNPDVNGITRTTQVRLVELVAFGPAKWSVHKTFLDDSMEPRQQEVETSPLHRGLCTHTHYRHRSESTKNHAKTSRTTENIKMRLLDSAFSSNHKRSTFMVSSKLIIWLRYWQIKPITTKMNTKKRNKPNKKQLWLTRFLRHHARKLTCSFSQIEDLLSPWVTESL